VLYEQAAAAQCTLGADGHLLELNARAAALLGLPRAQLLGRPFLQLIEPAHRLGFASRFADLLRAPQPVAGEEILLLPDGARRVHLEAVGGSAGGHPVCHLVLLDVTQAQREAQQLAASEQKFRQLFEHSTDAVALMEHERFVDCNAAVLTLLGASHKEQVLGHYPWELAPVEQRPGVRSEQYFRESVAAALQLGSKRCEGILCRLNGQYMWVEAVLTPITDGPAQLLHVVWRDITVQKQQERLHRETQVRLQLLQEATGAGQWSWELGTDKFVGDARARACLGWAAEQEPGQAFDAFREALHPDDAPAVLDALARAQPEGYQPPLQFRVLWPDGSVHRISVRAWTSHDPFGQPLRLLGVILEQPGD
jgi:PAS domain S-box-containing protein